MEEKYLEKIRVYYSYLKSEIDRYRKLYDEGSKLPSTVSIICIKEEISLLEKILKNFEDNFPELKDKNKILESSETTRLK